MTTLFLSFKLALSKVCKQSEQRKFCIFKYKMLANIEIRTLDVPKGVWGHKHTCSPNFWKCRGHVSPLPLLLRPWLVSLIFKRITKFKKLKAYFLVKQMYNRTVKYILYLLTREAAFIEGYASVYDHITVPTAMKNNANPRICPICLLHIWK